MFSLSVQEGRGYFLIVASGAGSVVPLCASSKFIAEVLQRTGARRVLLDMMALTPLVDDSERQEVLDGLYATIAKLDRLAILMPRAVSLGLLLEAARTEGVDACEFDDVLQAEKWLQR